MSSSNSGSGDTKLDPDTSNDKAKQNDMPQSTATAEASTPTDNWWDGQLKALYQSVIEEPLPEDMLKLVQSPKLKTGDVAAKGSRKQEDE